MFFVFLQAKAYDYKRIFNKFKPKQKQQQQRSQKSCTHSCAGDSMSRTEQWKGREGGGGEEEEEKEQKCQIAMSFSSL